MKNSIIVLKGVRKEIVVTESQAKQIDEIFNDSACDNDYVIRINGMSFRKGQIIRIELAPDKDEGDKWNDYTKNFYIEEANRHERYMKMTAEEKAKMLDMFYYLYRHAMTSDPKKIIDPDKETLEKAYQVQLEFFKEHPKRVLCDLYLLKKLIPADKPIVKNSNNLWDESPLMFRDAYFRFVEKAVFRDMQLAGQLNTKIELPKPAEAKFGETPIESKIRIENDRKNEKEYEDFVKEAVNNF